MGLFSHEEFQDPADAQGGGVSGGVVERARRAELGEYGWMTLWWWVRVCRPRMVPAVSSRCSFTSTSMLLRLKRIADMRGERAGGVPAGDRVFVAQQEGEPGALLAAEAEAADYRPTLGQA